MFKFASLVILALLLVGPQQQRSLCTSDEKIVFNCTLKNSKIVSLCSSREISKDRGYLQYRFGKPGSIELEFPKERDTYQQVFTYTHYFRAQVDLTEISFTSEGHHYSIFDDYNGEERLARSVQGLKVTPPKRKEVTLNCRERAKADYSNLGELFAIEP